MDNQCLALRSMIRVVVSDAHDLVLPVGLARGVPLRNPSVLRVACTQGYLDASFSCYGEVDPTLLTPKSL
jgi:hypothetical protein